jgi:hypothetical protein
VIPSVADAAARRTVRLRGRLGTLIRVINHRATEQLTSGAFVSVPVDRLEVVQ